MPQVVILSADEDADVLENLIAHFQSAKIDFWSKNNAPIGKSFSDAFDSAVRDSEIVVALLSLDLLQKHENLFDIACESNGFIPVLVKPGDIMHHDQLNGRMALPRDGRPLLPDENNYSDRLTAVAKEIITVVKDKNNLDILLKDYRKFINSNAL